MLTDGQEDVIDVHARLRGRFHEEQSILLGILLRFIELHHPNVRQIRLVAGQRNDNVW